MLKNQIYTICLLVLAFSNALFSQEQEFFGTLKADGIEAISIKLLFTIEADGAIHGKSITDFEGPNETTSSLEGQLFVKKRTLSFREIRNLNTKADTGLADFCYISTEALEITSIDDKNMIIGPFKGQFSNGEFCAEGQIHIVGPDILNNIHEKKESAKVSKKEASIVEKEKEAPAPPVDLSQPLLNGTKVPLSWQTDSLRLDLWDTFEEDNDRVSIYCNGKLVKQNLEIKRYKQSFYFPVEDGCLIQIKAENEGTNPPNTVNAVLSGGPYQQALVTKLKTGESVELEITPNAE